jgi:hypothetical protein
MPRRRIRQHLPLVEQLLFASMRSKPLDGNVSVKYLVMPNFDESIAA